MHAEHVRGSLNACTSRAYMHAHRRSTQRALRPVTHVSWQALNKQPTTRTITSNWLADWLIARLFERMIAWMIDWFWFNAAIIFSVLARWYHAVQIVESFNNDGIWSCHWICYQYLIFVRAWMYEFDDSNGDLIGNLDKAHALKPQCLFMSVTLCVAMICDWTCAVREVFINATGE